MADMRRMNVGQIIDFCVSYNERQEAAERADNQQQGGRRWATQAEIDAFCGR